MIIQSSNFNSSASRRYNSLQSSYVENKTWDNATGTTFTEACSSVVQRTEIYASKNGAFCDMPLDQIDKSEHEFCSDELPTIDSAEQTDKSEKELDDLMGAFKRYRTSAIPTIQERMKMVRDRQQKTLDYLLRILFDQKAEYTHGAKHIDRTTSAAEKSANHPVTHESELLGQTLGTGGHHESSVKEGDSLILGNRNYLFPDHWYCHYSRWT